MTPYMVRLVVWTPTGLTTRTRIWCVSHGGCARAEAIAVSQELMKMLGRDWEDADPDRYVRVLSSGEVTDSADLPDQPPRPGKQLVTVG